MENVARLSVSQFIALTNQTFEQIYPAIEIEGEVAGFKVNQGKFVFFDLKDADGSLGCFMMVFQLRIPIEDGMKVIVRATPKLTKWGKFSLTVQTIRPSGEGSLRKSFELLRAKLDKEGLFALERKRPLPLMPERVAVISSTQAAGYRDFLRIIDDRWGGLTIDVAHTRVQGESAADQIIRALTYFNQRDVLPQAIVLLRGGGSADDLASFNDELLVRAIASSRVPVLSGIGHETDETLADLAADVRAATPSNAAQLLVPDKHEVARQLTRARVSINAALRRSIDNQLEQIPMTLGRATLAVQSQLERAEQRTETLGARLTAYDPERALRRGYSIMRGVVGVGEKLSIETAVHHITAEVTNVTKR